MNHIALEKAILNILDLAPPEGVTLGDIHAILRHDVPGMRIEHTLNCLVGSREARLTRVKTMALGQEVAAVVYSRGEKFTSRRAVTSKESWIGKGAATCGVVG